MLNVCVCVCVCVCHSIGSGWRLILMTLQPEVPALRCYTNQDLKSLDILFSCNSLGCSPCAVMNVSLSQEFYLQCTGPYLIQRIMLRV
jgi:hypothetical protein